MERVDEKRVIIGLDHTTGFAFERFAQAMFSALLGAEFVPLGGVGDGGADGFFDAGIFEEASQSHFLQITSQEDHRAKIRQTVKRLREVGRTPGQLTYVTTRAMRTIDKDEIELGQELEIAIRIRDRNYIRAHVNDTSGTRIAFHNHIEPNLGFLKRAGSSPVLGHSEHVTSPDVYVFLRQEVERERGVSDLLDAVIDALVLLALEGTDPDAGVLRSRDEVIDRILEAVPAAKQFATAERVNNRLQAMASKKYPGGRTVRWHQQDNVFALPYDTRRRIEQENEEDTALHVRMKDTLQSRLADAELDGADLDLAVDVAIDAIRRSFEKEGLAFAHFLERRPLEGPQRVAIQDSIADVLFGRGVGGERGAAVASAAIDALRGSFYASTEVERLYLSKLSRTYGLLFTLKAEPRLVEYFSDLAADLHLYVGSDILVRTLSERYLRPEDQMTRNMLRMASAAGATLVLTEPVLDEVLGNLRKADATFKANYAHAAEHLGIEFARHIDAILIRAFFYARNDPETHVLAPRTWEQFVNQFCDYGDLHRGPGSRSLRDYLTGEFGLAYEEREELQSLVDDDLLAQLEATFREVKDQDVLATNDTLLTLAVFGRRRKRGESGRGTEFGYRTWWLTHETRILRLTRRLVEDYSPFMMRPEFLLNFIALAPSAADVRQTYANVFPSLQGIRLAKRMEPEPFKKLMKEVDDAIDMEPGRRRATMAKLSDQLKSDFVRTYEGHIA